MKTYLQVFKFGELSEKAKQRAISSDDELIYFYINDSIDDQLKDYFKPMLEECGLEKVSITTDSYDNVNISFSSIDYNILNKIIFEKDSDFLEETKEIEFEASKIRFLEVLLYNDSLDEKVLDEIHAKYKKTLKEFINKKESEINEFIQAEQKYYFSEEVLKECIFADNYFTKEGKKL